VLNWRSETLNALASSEAYVQARERVLLEMTSNAFDAISQVFPIIKVSRDSRVRFNEEVAIPAATLMSKIQLSASYYSIRIPLNPLLRYYHVNSEHLSTARFMDLGTRRLLKPGSAVDAESNGDIGHVIIPLEPHLSRENEGKKGTILRQEMLLLQLNRPLKKRHQAFRLRMEN